MESWSVSSLPGRAKAIAWSDFYSERVEKVNITPADEDCEAQIRIGEFGPLRIMQMSCGRCLIDRAPHHIARASGRVYSLLYQARGSGVFAHYGQEITLNPGDFTLCHGEAPYTYQLQEPCEVVMVRVPANVLKEHLPSPDYFCGRDLPARVGLTEAAGTLISHLCVERSSALSEDFQHRVARHLLDMLATSYAIVFESEITSSANISAWHARAKLHIEQHLRKPDLSPCSIANKLNLSQRYLRTIFASSEETVSAYILRRRLEECARQIEDPRWHGHSITEIAFSWGFNSAPHFTRSFRNRYGVPPRQFRNLRASA